MLNAEFLSRYFFAPVWSVAHDANKSPHRKNSENVNWFSASFWECCCFC